MTRSLTLSSRLLLILLGSLVLLGTASVIVLHLREHGDAHGYATRFPRAMQAAGIIDLIATAPPSERVAILRAANGVDLTVRLAEVAPPPGILQPAPRLQARVTQFLRAKIAITTYVNPHYRPRRDRVGTEGFLARAVARLPDGRFLVIDNHGGQDADAPRLFGVAASLWLGGLAALVTVVAFWATYREMQPLQRLVGAVRAFDGEAVTVSPLNTGAKDIHQTSIAVIAMQERVVDLLGERSLIIGAISHDLRTLMTKMRLRVEALANEPAKARLEQDLEGMEAMLKDGLAFARGTAGRATWVRLDLADAVAAEVADRQVRAEPVEIEADLQDAPVLGDSHALRRVVANLLDNAMQHGGGRIRAATRTEGDLAHLIFEDDGPGIPEHQRGVVLQPYQRGEDSLRRGAGGSGLGLAIVQQIVHSHQGKLRITRSDMGGAKVVVSLRAPP